MHPSPDRVLIEAALKAILPRPFTIAQIQPESTRPQFGGGWCGVFRWCRDFAARGYTTLEDDPTLPQFDLIVVHVDADVAEKQYSDGGPALAASAAGILTLPCSQPCPPASNSVDALRQRVLHWLNINASGPRTVFCIPSKSTEAWLATSILDSAHPLIPGIECNLDIATDLAQLPLHQRVRKTQRDYQRFAPIMTTMWSKAVATCAQASRFTEDVASIFQANPSP